MGLLGSGFARAILQKANRYRFGTVLLQGQNYWIYKKHLMIISAKVIRRILFILQQG